MNCSLGYRLAWRYSYKIVDVGQILNRWLTWYPSLHSRDTPLLPRRIKIKVNAAESAHCKSVQIFPQIISVPCSCSQCADPTVSSSAHMSQAVSMVSIMQCIVAAMAHLVPYLVPIFRARVTAHCNNLRGQHYTLPLIEFLNFEHRYPRKVVSITEYCSQKGHP